MEWLCLLATCFWVGDASLRASLNGAQGPSRHAPLPSVVLITIDTLRADHLGCYGYHRILTPTIDKLASEGIRYERAYARLALQYREDGDAARARQYYQKACNLSEEVCRELLAQL